MENITTIFDSEGGEHIIIDHGDDTFTSMTKAEYDRRQAAQSTPSL
jgi:hypothetical protein